MYGSWGSGGWNAGDAKRLYEEYSLSHGKTPGGGGTGGGSAGRWTVGKLFGQLFLIVILACLFKGLLMPVLAAAAAGALALVIYCIVRLASGGRKE